MNLTGIKNIDFKILNNLDDNSLVKYCSLNKKANKVCNNQIFWMNRILTKYPYLNIKMVRKYKGNREWSDYYINDLRKINTSNADDKLIMFSSKGRLDLVLIAINHGADIHNSHDSALFCASEEGHLNIVKYLVSQGANIHAVDDDTLRATSAEGHLEVVKYLVSLGANIHANDDEAVKEANYYCHEEIVKYLVSLGAPDPRI